MNVLFGKREVSLRRLSAKNFRDVKVAHLIDADASIASGSRLVQEAARTSLRDAISEVVIAPQAQPSSLTFEDAEVSTLLMIRIDMLSMCNQTAQAVLRSASCQRFLKRHAVFLATFVYAERSAFRFPDARRLSHLIPQEGNMAKKAKKAKKATKAKSAVKKTAKKTKKVAKKKK